MAHWFGLDVTSVCVPVPKDLERCLRALRMV